MGIDEYYPNPTSLYPIKCHVLDLNLYFTCQVTSPRPCTLGNVTYWILTAIFPTPPHHPPIHKKMSFAEAELELSLSHLYTQEAEPTNPSQPRQASQDSQAKPTRDGLIRSPWDGQRRDRVVCESHPILKAIMIDTQRFSRCVSLFYLALLNSFLDEVIIIKTPWPGGVYYCGF